MKDKNKTKKEAWITIKIDPALYQALKEYCKEKGLKMGHVSSKAIEKEIAALKSDLFSLVKS
jgi:hypothetical protein